MFSFAEQIVRKAEYATGHSASPEAVLSVLRQLSMEDFGAFLITLPDERFPALSAMLPAMASAEIQEQWTGATGIELFKQTAAFARQLESAFVRFAGRPLQGSSILDFGVGYGRNMRSMLYYTDPDKLWGVDAWAGSLDLSRRDRVPGHLEQSALLPTELPVGAVKFDLIYAFSVFTHLSALAATACLAAMRKHIREDGLLVVTIRPVEYWGLTNQHFDHALSEALTNAHLDGYAFSPIAWSDDPNYGDASMPIEFFNSSDWSVAGYDTSLSDPYQISVIMRPVC